MKKKVFGTRNYREQEEGEYLSDVTGAAEESQLSGEPAPREHAVHVNVVQLADEEPGGGVQADAELPHILLGREITNRR